MTIEEALIKSEFGMTYTDEEHDQIIKWLKELKHYQLGDCMNDCEHYENCSNYIYSKGYNTAIDDFVKLINEISGWTPNCIEHNLSLTVFTLHQIAEELKG